MDLKEFSDDIGESSKQKKSSAIYPDHDESNINILDDHESGGEQLGLFGLGTRTDMKGTDKNDKT